MVFDHQRGADPSGHPHPMVLQLEPRDRYPPLVRVRRWVAAALAGLADEHVYAALLVATELVTNAFEHGGGPRQIRLARSRRPCGVRIEVDDVATGEPAVGDVRPESAGGRGLIIVDRFATDWGVSAWRQGKTVWASIECGNNPLVAPCPPDVG